MPELPEVETVKRTLEKLIISHKLDEPIIYYANMIKTDIEEYKHSLKDKTILSLDRKGKFLIINLDDKKRILFHLRMEGKLYVVKKENYDKKHLSMIIPFIDNDEALAFYDVRKFGVTYLLSEDEKGPLNNIGKEPFEIKEDELYLKYHSSNKMIKELLLDQSIMSGLGNIYANEVLFKTKLSPFLKGNELRKEDCKNIIDASIEILNLAIKYNGSTVRSYHASKDTSGEFQDFLNVYSKNGEECKICHHKIEKRFISSRSVEYCPICQNAGLNIAVTGKIASGKSLAVSYFKEEGFKTFSCDEYIHSLYNDKIFLKSLKQEFPFLFTPELNKKIITEKLMSDKAFKRKYLNRIYAEVKSGINSFIINNNNVDKVFEVPVLFDAHMDKDFHIIIGVETSKQLEHLKERGEDITRAKFNEMNSYDKNKDKLDFILNTDYEKEYLHKQVKETISKIKNNK